MSPLSVTSLIVFALLFAAALVEMWRYPFGPDDDDEDEDDFEDDGGGLA